MTKAITLIPKLAPTRYFYCMEADGI